MPSLHQLRRWMIAPRRANRQKPQRRSTRLGLERLEARVVLANSISITTGGLTTIPAGASVFSDTGNYTISPSVFNVGGNVTLQANVDITLNNALPALNNGKNLTFRAGRSIFLGGVISDSNAVLSFTANDPGANQAQRTAGDATITAYPGFILANSGGTVTFTGGTGDSAGANTHPNCPVVLHSMVNISAGGGITMTGTGNGANANGIDIAGATIDGSGGNLSLTGTGTGDSAAFGVGMSTGGTVKTNGGGTVNITGTGSQGVQLRETSSVTTVDGLLSITGNSPASSAFYSHGLFIAGSSTVQATGNGGVALIGTGSPNGINDMGVYLNDGATVRVNNGILNVTGRGKGAGTNIGINVEGSTIKSTGSGQIHFTGFAPGDSAGISFADTLGGGTGTLTTNSGNVSLVANVIDLGSARSFSNSGNANLQFSPKASRPIVLGGGDTAGNLTFTDTDLAAITGFGTIIIGNTSGEAAPISTANNQTFAANLVIGGSPSVTTSAVTISKTISVGAHDLSVITGGPVLVGTGAQLAATGGGKIEIAGTATGGAGVDNPAVQIRGVVSTVDGSINIEGTGAGSGGSNYGVDVVTPGLVKSTGNGAVTLNGSGGTGGFSPGIELEGEPSTTTVTLVSTNNGTLTLNGTGIGAAPNYGVSIEQRAQAQATGTGSIVVNGGVAGITLKPFGSPAGSLSVATGNVTLTGDLISTPAANIVTATGPASQLFFQPSTAALPMRIGGPAAAGKLVFNDTNLAAISGFKGITIGRADSAGNVDMGGTIGTFNTDLVVQSPSNNTDGIGVNQVLNVGAHNLTLTSGGPVAVNTGGQLLASTGGSILVTGTGSAVTAIGVAVIGGVINGGGGNVSLTGTGTGNTGAFGVALSAGGKVQTNSAGTVNVNGTGSKGVQINGAGSAVSTVDGLLSITANSPANTGAFAEGILIAVGGTVQATGTGGVALIGTGSPNGIDDTGVDLFSGATVSVNNGPLYITGIGRGAAGNNIGVNVEGSTVKSTGSGSITIAGIAPGDKAAVAFNGNYRGGAGTLTAGTGPVTLTGDVINFGGANGISGTGALVFQPFTASRPIQIGGSNTAGKLVFTDTDRAALANGFTQIIIGRSDSSGAISTGSAPAAFTSDVVIQSPAAGSRGISINHSLEVGAHNLTLATSGTLTVGSNANLDVNGKSLSFGGSSVVLGNAAVNAGAGGQILFYGNTSLSAGTFLLVDLGAAHINGVQFILVEGSINLGGATLEASSPGGIPLGTQFKLIDKFGGDAVMGAFAQGSSLKVAGENYQINTAGGDGNDVVLTRANPVRQIVVILVSKTVKVRNMRTKVLFIDALFTDNAQFKSETKSPFQSPAYKMIQITTADTNGDGVIDRVTVSGKKGRKIKTVVLNV